MAALADSFQAVLDVLPDDWTDMDVDVRIFDESRYVEACLLMTTAGAQPYSQHDWHWRVAVAHRFGHAAAPEALLTALTLLEDVGITAEFAIRDMRSGRVPTTSGWGLPESMRREFRQRHGQ